MNPNTQQPAPTSPTDQLGDPIPEKIPPPIEPVKVVENSQKVKKSLKRKRANVATLQSNPENEAKKRTSEVLMRILARTAVNHAIKARRPLKQNVSIREAEQGYMNQLWDRYTRDALRIRGGYSLFW